MREGVRISLNKHRVIIQAGIGVGRNKPGSRLLHFKLHFPMNHVDEVYFSSETKIAKSRLKTLTCPPYCCKHILTQGCSCTRGRMRSCIGVCLRLNSSVRSRIRSYLISPKPSVMHQVTHGTCNAKIGINIACVFLYAASKLV